MGSKLPLDRYIVKPKTLNQVAQEMRIPQPYLHRIVSGKQTPSVKAARQIFDHLNVRPADRVACIDHWKEPHVRAIEAWSEAMPGESW